MVKIIRVIKRKRVSKCAFTMPIETLHRVMRLRDRDRYRDREELRDLEG